MTFNVRLAKGVYDIVTCGCWPITHLPEECPVKIPPQLQSPILRTVRERESQVEILKMLAERREADTLRQQRQAAFDQEKYEMIKEAFHSVPNVILPRREPLTLQNNGSSQPSIGRHSNQNTAGSNQRGNVPNGSHARRSAQPIQIGFSSEQPLSWESFTGSGRRDMEGSRSALPDCNISSAPLDQWPSFQPSDGQTALNEVEARPQPSTSNDINPFPSGGRTRRGSDPYDGIPPLRPSRLNTYRTETNGSMIRPVTAVSMIASPSNDQRRRHGSDPLEGLPPLKAPRLDTYRTETNGIEIIPATSVPKIANPSIAQRRKSVGSFKSNPYSSDEDENEYDPGQENIEYHFSEKETGR